MDSRKDQLQLLEHFGSAIKNDSARPQIAQLTELGLLEITRKRQGQNIYELFGKQSLNSYGLGQLSLMHEKVQIQKVSKVINEENIPEESQSHINNKSDVFENEEKTLQIDDSNSIYEDSNSENNISKQKTEITTVNITKDEEEVYRNLGINPSILLDNQANKENIIVHIVRPGEDPEEILSNAKEIYSLNSSKSRRKNRYSEKLLNKESNEIQVSENNNLEKIEELDIEDLKKDKNYKAEDQYNPQDVIQLDTELPEIKSTEELEDPRRKRRRSSASK